MFQPSTNCTGFGACPPSPSGAPLLAQAVRVSMSARDSDRSLENLPKCGSAYHGGMRLRITASRIAAAQGRASLYVSSDIGAASPGRWQPWQFFWSIGATSLLNVTADSLATRPPANRIAVLAVIPNTIAFIVPLLYGAADRKDPST